MKPKMMLSLVAALTLAACGTSTDTNQQQAEQANETAFDVSNDGELGTANLTTDADPYEVDAAVNQVDDANELNNVR